MSVMARVVFQALHHAPVSHGPLPGLFPPPPSPCPEQAIVTRGIPDLDASIHLVR